MKLEKVPLDRVPWVQPTLRTHLNWDWINYMVEDVKKHGVQNPPHLAKKDNQYIPIDGWHRVYCAKKAGLKEIDAFVYEEGEVDPFILGLRLNMMQQSLDPISLAHAIKELIFNRHLSWKQVEDITGISDPHLRRLLTLLDLPEDTQRKIAAGELPAFGREAQKQPRPQYVGGAQIKPLSENREWNEHRGHFVEGTGKKREGGVRCPVCGQFPVKGTGKWVWFCPEHEDAYSAVLEYVYSGEWARE
jgi:ParB/RepB/Spo0J family partition protein